MIFALLTLLAALALASVAGWFSIVGFMSIYAGAPAYALIMGVVTESAKLVTTSWLYRNWNHSSWALKAPLIYFTIALMMATSIGVFGFLSKAHLEQGAGTIDNASKIERLEQQITREKSVIADNEKIIGQLDSTINSYIGKDRTDKSLAVRRMQEPQRKQLREDINIIQKRIDTFSEEKLILQSEVRKVQLDTGPIRYIAELLYGATGDTTKSIEAAVRIFTLLLVSTLDPLAIILLIAANHTLLRLRNEKLTILEEVRPIIEVEDIPPPAAEAVPTNHADVSLPIIIDPQDITLSPSVEDNIIEEVPGVDIQKDIADPIDIDVLLDSMDNDNGQYENNDEDIILYDKPVEPISEAEYIEPPDENNIKLVLTEKIHPSHSNILRELIGAHAHFIPQKIIEQHEDVPLPDSISSESNPKPLSWLQEFKKGII